MIQIEIERDQKHRVIRLEAKGHATDPKSGHKVCASVSSQIYGFVTALAEMSKDITGGVMGLGPEGGFGHADVAFKSYKTYRRAEYILMPVEAALKVLAERYPEEVILRRL